MPGVLCSLILSLLLVRDFLVGEAWVGKYVSLLDHQELRMPSSDGIKEEQMYESNTLLALIADMMISPYILFSMI